MEETDKEKCHDYAGFINGKENINISLEKENYLRGCEAEDENGCLVCKYGYTLDLVNRICISNCKEFIEPSSFCNYCEHGYLLTHDDTVCYSLLGNEAGSENKEDSMEFLNFKNIINFLFMISLL